MHPSTDIDRLGGGSSKGEWAADPEDVKSPLFFTCDARVLSRLFPTWPSQRREDAEARCTGSGLLPRAALICKALLCSEESMLVLSVFLPTPPAPPPPQLLLSAVHIFHLAFKRTVLKTADEWSSFNILLAPPSHCKRSLHVLGKLHNCRYSRLLCSVLGD